MGETVTRVSAILMNPFRGLDLQCDWWEIDGNCLSVRQVGDKKLLHIPLHRVEEIWTEEEPCQKP